MLTPTISIYESAADRRATEVAGLEIELGYLTRLLPCEATLSINGATAFVERGEPMELNVQFRDTVYLGSRVSVQRQLANLLRGWVKELEEKS